MFIGPKITTVFRSRWRALAWSAGVLLAVYSALPSQGEGDSDGLAVARAIAAPLPEGAGADQPGGQTGGGGPAAPPRSPWAPDAPPPANN